MECREAQDNLNNYIEGLLPSDTTKLFDEHLASCKKCSESLADIKKTIKHINAIEEIEPPLWLTQKVMAKVREEAEARQKKGIFNKLYSLFKINMPLKAVAGAAIVVIAIFIFRDILPVVQNTKTTSEETLQQESSKKKKKTRVLKKEKIVQESASVEKAEKQEQSLPYENSPRSSAGYDSLSKLSEAQKEPAPIAEQDKVSSFAGAPSPASPAKNEMRDEVRLEAKAVPLSRAKEKARVYNILFTVNVKDLTPAKNEIWKILSQSGGKVTKTESYKDRYVFFAELNPAKIKELNDKLKNIGEVKQKDIDSSIVQGNLSVKIEIVGM